MPGGSSSGSRSRTSRSGSSSSSSRSEISSSRSSRKGVAGRRWYRDGLRALPRGAHCKHCGLLHGLLLGGCAGKAKGSSSRKRRSKLGRAGGRAHGGDHCRGGLVGSGRRRRHHRLRG